MRAVLYTHDMEPITVIELEPWAWEFLREQGQVRLAVYRPACVRHDPDETPQPFDMSQWIVRITAEVLVRGQHSSLMLFTNDEEAALLLKSVFLPGQHREVQDREKSAFAQGFLHALNNLR
ncbi:hypothetical protein [Pseudomonas sp. MWU12-2345]|uniref:hypothetical protein n=1 Tax=Pseudomonas sp. MWU12-2345 TaxID=2928689 RepID=UPI00200D9E03|nr:hypothetical protein [Pseudomonas sp. MWU12-2345]